MNESSLIPLKTIVERVIRPVRASTSHKRKMREELLAHVLDVFEEETARLGDERAALERTAQRFGNAAEMTSDWQELVPASDGFVRFWEGQPHESALRSALRFAWVEGAIAMFACCFAFLVLGWKRPWSRDELMAVVSSSAFLPFWIFGPPWLFAVALVTHGMEKLLHGPEPLPGWPRIGLRKLLTSAWNVMAVRIALLSSGLFFFLLLCIRGAHWQTPRLDWDEGTVLIAGLLMAGLWGALSVMCAWVIVQSVDERRRYDDEWSRLPLEPHS